MTSSSPLFHLLHILPVTQVVAVEQLLGVDCDEAAEEYRLSEIESRETQERRAPANRGTDLVAYYEQLEASVQYKEQ